MDDLEEGRTSVQIAVKENGPDPKALAEPTLIIDGISMESDDIRAREAISKILPDLNNSFGSNGGPVQIDHSGFFGKGISTPAQKPHAG